MWKKRTTLFSLDGSEPGSRLGSPVVRRLEQGERMRPRGLLTRCALHARLVWWARFLAIVGLPGFVLVPAQGEAQSALEILEAGWGGTSVQGTWTPVRLRIRAGPRELRGLAELTVEAVLPARPKAAPIRVPIR